MRRQMKMVLCSMVVISMTASCQKTPDMEYVTNKEGYSTLIQDNATMDNGISVSQQVQAPTERIVETLEGTNDYTSIKIDAQVTVPEVTAMPAYQLRRLDVDSELAEQYVTAFFDDGMVRKCNESGAIYTEEDYLADIERITKELEDGQTQDGEEISEDTKEVYQIMIDKDLLAISNGMVLDSEYGNVGDYSFYSDEWGFQDFVYRSEFVGFNGERNGIEYNLFFMNDDINSEIMFYRTPDTPNTGDDVRGVGEKDVNSLSHNMDYRHDTNLKLENECRYSMEEAEEMCNEFLSELGIEEMTCGSIKDLEIHSSYLEILAGEPWVQGRNGYCLHYYRTMDTNISYSVLTEQESVVFNCISHNEYGSSDSYVWKKISNEYSAHPDASEEYWEDFEIPQMQEIAMFMVTDDGLISGAVINPMVTEECLAENVTLISFDRVLEQAKTQLVIQYGDTGTNHSRDQYKIKAIELSYARMQSPDMENEYILIPVWNFKLGDSGDVLVSINAIDGTVFNLEDGH